MDNLPENITNELIVAYLQGETSLEQSMLIQQWVDASNDNRQYVDNLKQIWSEAAKLSPAPVDVNVDAAWNKLSARIEEHKDKLVDLPVEQRRTSVFNKTLLKVAAVLIPAFLITYLFLIPKKESSQLVMVTTEKMQQKQLADGSVVKLNADSKLSYPEKFAENIREVTLDGEAFFEISPDKNRPFIIHSDKAAVKVVGTAFNVNAYKDNENIEVCVRSGIVLLYAVDTLTGDTSMVRLVAGNKGKFNRKTMKAFKKELTNENDMFWMTRTLVFNKTELSEVVKTLNKNYHASIELKNEKLSKLRLSATFNDQTIESILDVISTSFDLKVIKTKSTFVIDGEGN